MRSSPRHLVSLAVSRSWFLQKWVPFGLFVLLSTRLDAVRDGQAQFNELHLSITSNRETEFTLTLVELVKLVFALVSCLWIRKSSAILCHGMDRPWGHDRDDRDEEQPLQDMRSDHHGSGGGWREWRSDPNKVHGHGSMQVGTGKSTALIVIAAALHAYDYCLTSSTFPLVTATTPYLITSISTILTLITLATLLSRSFTTTQWHTVLLQLCGTVIAVHALTPDPQTKSTLPFVVALSLLHSLTVVFTKFVYETHSHSFMHVNVILFSSSLLIQGGIIVISRLAHVSALSIEDRPIILPLVKAGLDIIGLWIICYYNAAMHGLMTSFSSAIFLFTTALTSPYPDANGPSFDVSLALTTGCSLVVIAVMGWFWEMSQSSVEGGAEEELRENWHDKYERPRRVAGILVFTGLLFYASRILSQATSAQVQFQRQVSTSLASLEYPSTYPRPGSHSVSNLLSLSKTSCKRTPLPSLHWFDPKRRKYHHFDDVLLVVFFSHARYDANLDFYREVYSEWFPNIVFIGPASREDKGFRSSYDVLVDSYQSDEDLSYPGFYKMAGRMAHHMLYTAMREHPCYQGYLWAPFDTLLNVPRLQLYDQRYFWYHSPWGEYVDSPAFAEDYGHKDDDRPQTEEGEPGLDVDVDLDEMYTPGLTSTLESEEEEMIGDHNRNKSRHAPPANVSPDPAFNWTEGWKGWGNDWWWGDPHVGLEVCMTAYRELPADMRNQMASRFMNGTTRLIGGSADTVYIPGQHRELFMETLATFLDTDCFLEIATPTTIHLVVPPNDPILYIDHWWIWRPPFNATFVRQKWKQGFEVDTMHTFHWGDKDEDGVFRAHPEHIADLRALMLESAERQRIEWN